MPKQTTTPSARRRMPMRRASPPPPRRRAALPWRTASKEPQGFVPGLVSRVRPKRSAGKGKSGLSATLGNAVSGLTSGASAKKIAQKPGAKSIVGLAAGAGVGAAALLKRRRSASQAEEESTVTVIETPTSEPEREVTS